MSDPGRPRANRERWASDHERARQRSAERLSLPLPAAENGWLDRHLATCAPCASVAAEYLAQQQSLRSLEEPHPPRDLWARTAAALDRAERQVSRDAPNPSVFPGRGGVPGSRGARSIRGLRAEQRAASFRTEPRVTPSRLLAGRRAAPAPRPPGFGWVAPFGALAALAIVVVVGGNALLNGTTVTPVLQSTAAAQTLAAATNPTPFATPIQVGAGEVAWLTPADDGTYSLNFATVGTVCPTNARPDCAPISGASPRKLPTVTSTLHTVIRNPSKTQLVVVPNSTKKGAGGGSVVVIAVPTPVASIAPSASTSPAPVESVAASETPGGSSTPSDATSPSTAASGASGEPVAPASNDPGASAPATEPTSSDQASPTDVVAPSAGETSSAGSTAAVASLAPDATSAESPTAPQPTATALAIISNVVVVGETAAYSPDGTMLAFSARPADGSQGPDIYLWRPGDPTARPVTTDHASVFAGWLNNQLLGSRAVDTQGQPASSGSLVAPTEAGATDGSSPSLAPTDSLPAQVSQPTDQPAATPSASDVAPLDSSSADPSAAANLPAVNGAIAMNLPYADATGSAFARSFVVDPVTFAETDLAAPAWRPVVDPTGRFVAYWAGSLRYDPTSLTWLPDQGAIVLASWPALRGTDPTAILAPVPLLGDGTQLPTEWDIRWDESGQHIAIWIADTANPDLGRLTLLSIDAGGRIDPTGISLHDAPALAGFSIGADRLAWATPPGQDGEGSRLQVLAWSGDNAGNIDSQPVSGGDSVVVVR